MKATADNLIWIDLEMTGLDPEQERIIEIATLITDSQLNILDEGPNLAIYQPETLLAKMDAWNVKQHTQSGLLTRVRNSHITEQEAAVQTLAFMAQYVGPQQSPLCGNTVSQDRRFLRRYMPECERYFHYRHLDVSTVKELAKRWHPKLYQGHQKSSNHLALDDIRDSVAELKYYREHFFQLPATEE
jgi:oligoribonuclease